MGENAKDTLTLLVNLGAVNHNIGDYQAALDCYEQCQKVQVKKLGKIHPSMLMTLMNMANTYAGRLKDYPNGEEMLRRAPFGH